MTTRDSSPRRNRGFDAVVAIATTIAILVVYLVRIAPLSAPPAPPPPGLAIAWAGLALRHYAESVYVTATSCSAPVSVRLDLFPPSAASVSNRPAEEVAFAFVGDLTKGPISAPHIYGRGPSNPPRRERITATSRAYNRRGYAFDFTPRETPSISVEFSARWTAPRTAEGTCWLDIPAQIGVNNAALAANTLLGHASDWSGDERGFPIYHSDIYLQNNGASSALPIEPINSLPAPATIDPPEWSCEFQAAQASTCETFAVLTHAGAEGHRTREITLWSLAGGLLLAILGDALIAILRSLVVTEPVHSRKH